jgi:adenylyltransferase/sulfurtransferase
VSGIVIPGRSGVGKVGIIDHDKVSLSNLHRQTIYSVDDIGRNKAESAGEVLSALNPEIQICVYPFALTTENAWDIFYEFDVIIDGTDHFSTRYMINDLCVLINKPLVYGAVSGFEGSAFSF